jgi:N-acetylglucosamine kinase-like BadF-type ATPase
MRPVLGVEGGGSPCDALVADETGTVLGAAATGSAANWEDVGFQAAAAAIRACVGEALGNAGLRSEDVAASVFAMAGIDFPVDEQRLSGIPIALGLRGATRMVNDAYAALRAGTERSFGVAVVAGTGSVIAGRNPDGEEARSLGLGPMFGDSGSASEVSEAGLSAVADAFTGRGPETALTAMLCAETGSGSVDDLLEGAARGRIDGSVFSPTVKRAAHGGDQVSQAILRRAGEALGASALHIVRKLRMEPVGFDLVLAGGTFIDRTGILSDALVATVQAVAPNARPARLTVPAVVGAALMAVELCGGAPGPDTRERLSQGVPG